MRIFVSWSEERARKMAEALKGWLPDVLQYADVFFSEDDIAKGTRSDEELAKQLAGANFGITCLTPENLDKPWIVYETGALAHKFNRRACPYLLDLTPAQVPPPLGKLQCARADRDDTLKLLRSIEEAAGDKAVGNERLERGFARCWPELEAKLRAIPKPAAVAKAKREPDEMVAEILETVRGIAREGGGFRLPPTLSPATESLLRKLKASPSLSGVTLSEDEISELSAMSDRMSAALGLFYVKGGSAPAVAGAQAAQAVTTPDPALMVRPGSGSVAIDDTPPKKDEPKRNEPPKDERKK